MEVVPHVESMEDHLAMLKRTLKMACSVLEVFGML